MPVMVRSCDRLGAPTHSRGELSACGILLSTFCSTAAHTSRRQACHKGLPLHVSHIILQVQAQSSQCPDRHGSAVL